MSEAFLRLKTFFFPKSAKTHFDLGCYLYKVNRNLDRAEKEIQQAISIDPQNENCHLVLAYILHVKGRYLEAIDNYQQVLKINPCRENAYLNIGLLFHEKLQRPDEAEAAYCRAMELNPNNPDCFFQLGWLLLDRLNRPTEAETLFIKALELDPEDETALYNLACIKSIGRDSDSAFAFLQKAIEKGFDKNQIWNDKDFEWLRKDPRFTVIVGLRSGEIDLQ